MSSHKSATMQDMLLGDSQQHFAVGIIGFIEVDGGW